MVIHFGEYERRFADRTVEIGTIAQVVICVRFFSI